MNLIVVPIKPLIQNISLRLVNCCNNKPIIFIDNDKSCCLQQNESCLSSGTIKVNIKKDSIIKVKLIDNSSLLPIKNTNYNDLENIPTLNGVKIIGKKTSTDYRINDVVPLSNLEIEELLKNFI